MRRSLRVLGPGAALLLALTLPAAAWSAEVGGVRFAEDVRVGGLTLSLRGLGLLRYRVFFRGYAAALYVEPGARGERVLDGAAKRLELQYFWSIPGDRFAEAAEPVLRRNVDAATYEAIRERVDRIGAAYRDVEPGDRYSLTYLPGRGTELALNDEPLLTIVGEDFARAYFSIWLGEEPIDEGLRDDLLDSM